MIFLKIVNLCLLTATYDAIKLIMQIVYTSYPVGLIEWHFFVFNGSGL